MNSFGHLFVSLAKSVVRIGSCVWSVCSSNLVPMAIGFLVAEVLGIVEELVDCR